MFFFTDREVGYGGTKDVQQLIYKSQLRTIPILINTRSDY